VTTTSVVVAIIQDSIIFIDGQTFAKDGVDPVSIENISDEEVSRGLMVKVLTIFAREMIPKHLCPKVDKKVVVPRVIGGDEEEVLIREICIYGGSYTVKGKIHSEFV